MTRPSEQRGTPRYVPRATYRLQFHKGFTFDDARACLPYLAALGVSDVYASPLLKAVPGSTHGYDIIDHNVINPEIGGADGFAAFIEGLHRHALHLMLDTVPNHMGVGAGNAWWLDVLENGPSSQYAPFFDIDWEPPRAEMAHKVLLPILGDQFGRVLEAGDLRLGYEDGAFAVHYYDHLLPISPATYAAVLQPVLARVEEALPPGDEQRLELQSILTAISHLPSQTDTDPARREELAREKVILRRRLGALYDAGPVVRAAIMGVVRELNGQPGEPASFDGLAALLDRQSYRLSFWRVATEEINYRRFFDVNGLAALRMERPEVFEATHGLILRLIAARAVDGLRIDHPDGLRDPENYLRRLEARAGEALADRDDDGGLDERAAPAPPDAAELDAAITAATAGEHPLYLVVEKILEHGERLPPAWPVDGTTGYDYLNAVNGIFVDGANRKAFDALYTRFLRQTVVFNDLAYSTKKQIMRSVLASEVNVLGLRLSRVAARHRVYRDFTLNSLTSALIEVIACFPIYRTYIRPRIEEISERDRLYIQIAVDRAKRRNPAADQSIYAFIQDTLTLEGYSTEGDGPLDDQVDFILTFQQVSAPVMAKAVEDTAFYSYTRLVSLNEVGSDPDQFGMSVAAFHRQNAERAAKWRGGVLATATHDTKRGEDTRARINVLSELPREWAASLRRWGALNRTHKRVVHGRERWPDRNDEYLLYQTLAGAWPLDLLFDEQIDAGKHAAFAERIHAYMEKAVREAKVHTGWITQDGEYEGALHTFIDGALAQPERNPFVQEARPFVRRLAGLGLTNSLAQTLLKLTSPGVPDTYQGTDLWDFSLVDPDNRRPVNFAERAKALEGMRRRLRYDPAELAAELLASSHDGRIKLLLTHGALTFRAAHPALFAEGGYAAVETTGARADSIVAFVRTAGNEAALTVAPRLVARVSPDGAPPLGDGWGDTALLLRGESAASQWRDVVTGAVLAPESADGGATLPLARLFATLPFALLHRVP